MSWPEFDDKIGTLRRAAEYPLAPGGPPMVGSRIWELEVAGLIDKIQLPSGRDAYVINAEGRKYLAALDGEEPT